MSNLFNQSNPFALFKIWYDQAEKQEPSDPMAMSLATVNAAGQPSVRIVLMRQYDAEGFSFYTNYLSRKAADLSANAKAAINFYWKSTNRQVRAEGEIVKLSASESDDYFASRHSESQLGAWASQQSQNLESPQLLRDRLEEYRRDFAGKPIVRPPHWGGYKLVVNQIEFWQGQEHRLHDRELFIRTDNGWKSRILYP
ncbi:MAG: pyridoxamine 5'-phosphate oxidase [Alphaproteobacteria bacterium]|nr:MAG: pyridoxamine 5'-phosphate oxidase [Alphaproteobacteria bacterium]